MNTSNPTEVQQLSVDLSYVKSLGIDTSKLKQRRPKGRPRLYSTEQEIAILKLVSDGYSVPSIAQATGLSSATIFGIVERNKEVIIA